MWKPFSARFKGRAGRGLAGAAIALALGACDGGEGVNARNGPAGGANPIAPEPVVDAVPQEEPAVARTLWRAANEQARTVTGNLRVSLESRRGGPVIFAFATGITVRGQPSNVYPTSNRSGVGNSTFAQLMGADPRVDANLYRVGDETVTPSAPQGGLCGQVRASYLVVSEFVDQRERWVFRVAAFRGPSPPGVSGGSPQYCATYTFEAP